MAKKERLKFDLDIKEERTQTNGRGLQAIRYFLMLVATGSFSPERGLPVIFLC